jgi:tetratricopeptide (TPR) repeat protein
MRKSLYILLLVLSFGIIIVKPAHSQGWVDECIEYTIHSRFEEALRLVRGEILKDPQNYQAYFYLAATLSSKMTHFENNDDEHDFFSAIDSTVNIIEHKLEDTSGVDPKVHAKQLFYLGSAYGYLAFYQGRTGSYFPALSNGLESNNLLNLAVVVDSTLYDAYLGIGVFKYWRYSKLKFISWLPFIPDERDEGIEYIKLAIEKSASSQYMAMHQLVYILTDYGYANDAIEYAEKIIHRYPESQFMWWAAAKAYDKNDDLENAINAYTKLNKLLTMDPKANPNHLYKCQLKLAEIYQRKSDFKSCQDTCQNLLVLLDDIPVSDKDDKADDIRDMLNECLEKDQENN